ncbi:single-stranded DNA-binding protein [Candidatus Microgenomates bacterium]|nr:single-stranded DNA-binding protein [Candidatus Microgenomates bacterium]
MSARSLNKVQLIGNLTRDPELRYTPQGTAVCTIGLATNRSWTTDTGEKREETEFHRIVAWNKLAELCSQLCTKGRKIYVEGRLSTRTWTGQDGNQRTTTEIVIDDMILLDSRRPAESPAAGETAPVAEPAKEEAAESEKEEKASKPPKADKKVKAKSDLVKEEEPTEEPADITPDDIPF